MLSGRKSRNTKQTISRGSGTWHSHNVARPPPPSRPRHSSPQKGTQCPLSRVFHYSFRPTPAPKPLCSWFIFSLPQTWASSGHGACRGPSLSSVAHGCYLLLSIRSYEDKQLKGSDRGWLETTLFMSHPSLGHSSALQLLDYGKEVSFKVGPS